MIARDSKKTWDYVLLKDRTRPPEERTTWTLGVITARQHAAIADASFLMNLDGSVRGTKGGTYALLQLAYGLRGVKGFKDEEGKEIEIAWAEGPGGPMVASEFLDRIPFEVRDELSHQIGVGNKVDADDRKN